MEKVKIDIISGFLGAGKTTFIKKLMRDLYSKDKVVILENEFGKINLDEQTLGREGLTIKPIQAGCICCSSSLDLSGAIREILIEYAPQRIIIEPTGIAKLSEIEKLLQNDENNKVYEIQHIVTIVDAKNYYIRTMISKNFFEDQIKASKVILLSKTTQMEEAQQNKVVEDIHKIQPDCLVVKEEWDNLKPTDLFKYMNNKQVCENVKHKLSMRKNYRNDFDSYEIVTDDSVDINTITKFIKKIEKGEFGEIHRIKGICHDPEKGFYSLDYIPVETTWKLLSDGQTKSTQSKLCLIGRQLDKTKLNQAFHT